jgi:hypothetical protein
MEFQLDPLAPSGISRVLRQESVVNLGSTISTTDDLPEGSTNLYSQWEAKTYGGNNYLQAIGNEGLVVGADLTTAISSAFVGAAGMFNGDIAGANNGLNFFGNLAYGSGYSAFGAFIVNGAADGTPAAPTQTLDTTYLGGMTFAGYDGTDWQFSGATHYLPGLIARAAADVTTGNIETDIWVGSLLHKMIGFETDTNAIKFNEAQLDSNITFYNDTTTTMVLDGGDGSVAIGSSGQAKFNNSGSLGISLAAGTNSSRLAISTLASGNIGITVRGSSGQTANLTEWQDSASSVVASITPSGTIRAGNFVTTGGGFTSSVASKALLTPNADTGGFRITTVDAANKGIVVQGSSSQSANLQEWQNNSATILASVNSSGVISSAVGTSTGNVTTIDGTQTLTNKRITKRVTAASDATSITPASDTADVTTQANTQALGTLTINNPTGTPTDGQELTLRIKSTNAHTYSFGSGYRGSLDTPLPTTHSGSSLTDYLKFIYNSADSKWDLVAIAGGY